MDRRGREAAGRNGGSGRSTRRSRSTGPIALARPLRGRRGIRALLDGLAASTAGSRSSRTTTRSGSPTPRGGGAISLEPGGQFELSGAPLATLHETVRRDGGSPRQGQARRRTALGIGFLDLGMSPLWTRAETPVMPKARYRIMTAYMPKVGSLGLDMMYRTATVQVNLDFGSEADMVRKMRVGLALQPVATALFANSPFTDGRPNGFLSRRSAIWLDTDRAALRHAALRLRRRLRLRAYVDWALDVPMYFVKRGDTYHDVAGASFRDLLAGQPAAVARRAGHPVRLGEPPLDPVSRGPAQALPGDARRRCRSAGAHRRPVRLLGRAALRRGRARRRLGPREGLVGGGSRAPARRRAPLGA